MKFLKILGVIIFILIVIYFVVPFFLADNVIVREDISIKAKPETVFRQVNSLENWIMWSPFESDSTMVSSFSGDERGVGSQRSWDGTEAGVGSMEILVSEPYTFIKNKLVFGPDGGGGVGSWTFDATDDGVNVRWSIHITDLSYPNLRWMGLFIDTGLKPMMTQGLNSLKELTEKMPQPPEVKMVTLEAQPSLVIPDSSTIEGMHEMFERNYTALMNFVKTKKIPITGQHFAIYHNWNPGGITRISAGIPVEKGSKGSKNIMYYEIPAGKAIFAIHTGGPNSAQTHYAIDDYIKDFKLKTKDYIWETYMYNPMEEPDTTKWVTFIYYPL